LYQKPSDSLDIYFKHKQRAQSPEVKATKRYNQPFKPRDGITTGARHVGINIYSGIKTELQNKPQDNLFAHG